MRKHLLLFALALLAFTSHAQIPYNGLSAYYPFNGNTNDCTGNGYNATLNGATLTTDRFNQPNSAYLLNGSSNFITTTFKGVLGSQSRTICAWVKLSSIKAQNPVLMYGSTVSSDGGTDRFLCELMNSPKQGVAIDNDGSRVIKSASLDSSKWHFYVWVLDNAVGSNITDIKMYVDGALLLNTVESYVPSVAAGAINTKADAMVTIGKFDTNFLHGKIDDIRIYDRALGNYELDQLFNENSCLLVKSEPLQPSNNSSIHGVTLTSDRFGNPNKAYNFDGIDDYINLGKMPLQTFAISTWLYITYVNPSNLNAIVSKLTTVPYKGLEFRVEPDNTLLLVTGNGSSWTQPKSTYKLSNKTWYHVVATYDCLMVRLYVNSELISSYPFSNYKDNDSDVIMGTRDTSVSYGGWYTGGMGETKIFNRSIDSTEIKTMFTQGICYQSATVTDTLIINSKITGFNPLTYANTIKAYPNPTSGTLQVDISNSNTLNQYTIKLIDNLGSVKFENIINAGSFNINLSGYAAGLYHFILIDTNGKVVENKNIVIQK